MALNRGVEWVIRWVTDQDSRRKVEADGRESAEKTGAAFENASDRAQTRWGKFTGFMRSEIVKIGAALAAAFAVTRIVRFGAEVIKLGIDARETASAFSTVFGNASRGLDEFLEKFTLLAGISQAQGREFLTNIGAISQGMGLARDESAAFSQQILEAAGDLTSFKNVPMEQTVRAITSAIVGEREALKTLGIVVRQVDVDNRAMAASGKKNAEALTDEERATASLAIIKERMGVITGDLERTQESESNTLRRAIGLWREFKEQLGGALLDTGLVSDALGVVVRQLRGMVESVRENRAEIAKWGGIFVGTINAIAQTLVAPIRLAFNFGQAIAEALNLASAGFDLLQGKIEEFLPGGSTGQERIYNATLNIAKAQLGLKDALSDSVGALVNVGDAWIGVAKAATTAAVAQSDAINMSQDSTEAPGTGAGSGLGAAVAGLGSVGGRSFRRRLGGSLGADAGLAERSRVAREAATAEMEELTRASTEMAMTMTDAWTATFEAIGSGVGVFQSLRLAAAGTAQAVLQELVKGKVAYHIAEGTGKLASGVWPPNPAAIASAMKHFAAAALFRAIPGVAGAAIAGGGSVAGGTAVQRDSFAGFARTDGTGAGGRDGGGDIIIRIDAIDPYSAKAQRVIGEAADRYRERTGRNVILNPNA